MALWGVGEFEIAHDGGLGDAERAGELAERLTVVSERD